jgi:hypothetical protein
MTLSDDELDFITFVEQEYLSGGGIPTAASCVERGIVTENFYRKVFKKADFRHALAVRGISIRGLDGPDSGRLTEEQLVVANTMLDLRDNRSQKKKLTELGVPTQKWEAWLRDPVFQGYLRSRSEALLGDSLHESHLALVDRVRTGDVAAIKYFNEITGRYVPNAGDKADVNSVIMMIVEVIQRHVTDPKTLELLADDITLIAGGVNAVQQGNRLAPALNQPTPNARPLGYNNGKKMVESKVIEL